MNRIQGIINRIIRYFTQHPLWLKVLEWSKTHSLPGLSKIPLYNLVAFIDGELKEDLFVTLHTSIKQIMPGAAGEVEKETLGDLSVLAQLREQLEKK